MFHSPLAEKRLAISLAKKHLVGRRAYSDSIYITKSPKYPLSLSSSESSPAPSPVSEIQYKAFGGVHAC
jgi:hypothetical protein